MYEHDNLHFGNGRSTLLDSRHRLATTVALHAYDAAADLSGITSGEADWLRILAKGLVLGGRYLVLALTVAAMVGGMSPAHATYQPNVALAVIGSTPAQVDAKFTSVIYHNLYTGNPARFANLSNGEWQALAYSYTRVGGSLASLDAMVAARVPTVYAHYHYVSRLKSPFVPPSTGINNTFTEIYLDFRTAPFGAATATSALLETAVFGAVLLKGSYEFGQVVGGAMHYLIENYDPALDNAIGADAAWFVSEIGYIGSSLASIRGEAEYSLTVNFFQIQLDTLGSFSDGFGDFGLMDDITPTDIGNLCVNPGDC